MSELFNIQCFTTGKIAYALSKLQSANARVIFVAVVEDIR